ncbi:MAG: LysR family transcriptional regulator [Alphaproteobacteria bacterium]|nr:LysR family transcriptional regulator [Alphaproteobacteria bacterium]
MPDRFSSVDLSAFDWDDLKVFLAVARAGSLRGAARALGVNHATVTRRLKALEAGLGTTVFDRTPDAFVLAQAGEELLRSAERIEDEILAAQRLIAGRDADPAGVVRISMPWAVMHGFLAEKIVAFSVRYPTIELDIELSDAFSDLSRREADVSIRMAHEVTDDVVGRRLGQYAKAIYASPEFFKSRDPSDRQNGEAVWIGWGGEEAAGRASWTRQTPFPELAVRHRMPTHALQVAAAKAGLGLTMLPCFLGDTEPGLVRAPGASPIPDRSLWLLLHDDLRKAARVRAFVDFIAEAIGQARPLLEGRLPDERLPRET